MPVVPTSIAHLVIFIREVASVLVYEIAVLFVALMKQEINVMTEAELPVTAKQKAPFVCNRKLAREQAPEAENVAVPTIVAVGMRSDPCMPDKFTPALRVKFSVYVPLLIKILVPAEAAFIAAWIVV